MFNYSFKFNFVLTTRIGMKWQEFILLQSNLKTAPSVLSVTVWSLPLKEGSKWENSSPSFYSFGSEGGSQGNKFPKSSTCQAIPLFSNTQRCWISDSAMNQNSVLQSGFKRMPVPFSESFLQGKWSLLSNGHSWCLKPACLPSLQQNSAKAFPRIPESWRCTTHAVHRLCTIWPAFKLLYSWRV